MNNPQYGSHPARKPSPIEKTAQEALKKKFDELVLKTFLPAIKKTTTCHLVTDILATMFTQNLGRRTIANALVCQDRDQQDWNPAYRAFHEAKWDPVDLFEGVFKAALPLLPAKGPVTLGVDDLGLPRTGNNLENAGWIHNPLVPKYVRPAIQWGIPVLHAALLIPSAMVHRPLAITVAFEAIPKEKGGKKPKSQASPKGDATTKTEAEPVPPPPKKIGRPTKAEADKKKAERDAIIRQIAKDEASGAVSAIKLKATELAVRVIWRIRRWMNEAGMEDRTLLVVGDGSYTNQTVMLNLPPNTEYAGRTRPDTKLHPMGRVTKSGSFQFGQELPTPKELAESHQLQQITGMFDYAGSCRGLKFLAMGPVFRKTTIKKKPLRLMILEPVPYGRGKNKPKGYNLRAFLLTTDMSLPPETIVAAYLMRWELEVLHRIFKTDLGIGSAQVRKHKLPAAMVAYYALLLIAMRLTQGQVRHAGYGPMPKWIAVRRSWFERVEIADGKPAPVYRPSPTEIKTLIIRALLPKGTRIHRLVA